MHTGWSAGIYRKDEPMSQAWNNRWSYNMQGVLKRSGHFGLTNFLALQNTIILNKHIFILTCLCNNSKCNWWKVLVNKKYFFLNLWQKLTRSSRYISFICYLHILSNQRMVLLFFLRVNVFEKGSQCLSKPFMLTLIILLIKWNWGIN